MGMGVLIGWRPMGGPPAVAHGEECFSLVLVHQLPELSQLSCSLQDPDLPRVQISDPCAIVAAVFQPFQLVENHAHRVLRTDIPRNAAHAGNCDTSSPSLGACVLAPALAGCRLGAI